MDTGSLLLLRRDTGYDCGNDRDCLMDDGSGYYVPTIDEVTIRASGPWGNGHNFHTVHINVTDAAEGYIINPVWANTRAPWGLHSCTDWLAETARRPIPR